MSLELVDLEFAEYIRCHPRDFVAILFQDGFSTLGTFFDAVHVGNNRTANKA